MCSSDLLVFERTGGAITLRAESSGERGANGSIVAQALLLGGKPLGEPVVRYGPFVMNTREEIVRAFEEYQAGRLVAQR